MLNYVIVIIEFEMINNHDLHFGKVLICEMLPQKKRQSYLSKQKKRNVTPRERQQGGVLGQYQ